MMMSLPGTIRLSASIGGALYDATLEGDNSIQVTDSPQSWTATPVNPSDPAQGYTLSVNGRYLSTQTVHLTYKNDCLVVTSDPSRAARVIPVAAGGSYYLQLVGSSNVFTLDTRGYVTQFEPLAPNNDFPYFQHLVPPETPGWMLAVHNESGKAVVAPAPSVRFSQGQQACITVEGLGCILLLDLGPAPGAQCGVQVTSGAHRQVLAYSGSTTLRVKLGTDNTFSVSADGSSQVLTGPISGAEVAMVALPASQKVYVSAFTNASYLQRVTLTVNGGTPQQWQGNGEGNQEIAHTSLIIPSDPSGWVNASVLTEFSPSGSPFQPSKMSPIGTFSVYGYNQRMIVSEDADDDDYNDTALILSWWMAPPTR
jgi:hypothetical protein